MHIVMERLNAESGDLHDVIHDSAHWEISPPRIRPRMYASMDDYGDVSLYTMPWEMKVSIATQLAKALRELRLAEAVHNDIKPNNILLLKRKEGAQEPRKGEPLRRRIKLIDFGEGGHPDSEAALSRDFRDHSIPPFFLPLQ